MKRIPAKYKGILYIIISAFCFAFMNAFVRLSGNLPSFQKSFFRNFVAFFFALIVLIRQGSDFKIKKGNFKFLFLRSFIGTLGILGNFYAIDHLVLSDASMLNKMSPFFVIIFSFLILKEKLTLLQGIAVVIAFIGSMFIVKPTFQNMDLLASTLGFFGGVCAGFAYTMVRILSKRGQSGAFVVFFFSAFSCLFTLPFMIATFEPMTVKQVLALLGAGLAATGGQFGITSAYFYAPAKEVSVYDYVQIIFSAILGYLMFHQIPDSYSFLGYFLIVSMAVLMFFYNNKLLFFKTKQVAPNMEKPIENKSE